MIHYNLKGPVSMLLMVQRKRWRTFNCLRMKNLSKTAVFSTTKCSQKLYLWKLLQSRCEKRKCSTTCLLTRDSLLWRSLKTRSNKDWTDWTTGKSLHLSTSVTQRKLTNSLPWPSSTCQWSPSTASPSPEMPNLKIAYNWKRNLKTTRLSAIMSWWKRQDDKYDSPTYDVTNPASSGKRSLPHLINTQQKQKLLSEKTNPSTVPSYTKFIQKPILNNSRLFP